MKRFLLSLSLLTALIANCATPTLLSRVNTEAAKHWVDSVYNTMSPRDRITQLFVRMVNPADGEVSKAYIKKLVNDYHIGGMLFSKGTLAQFADMTSYAQSLSRVPLLMTLDGEWGPAMRVSDVGRFPYNMGLGAISNERLLYDYGKETARQCKLMGIHVNFSPVMDVNSNPSNPVIGYRSFGEDPERVAALGIAYSKGMEESGVMSVAKHFPGHGDTSTDSHKTLPVVSHDLKKLQKTDLLPFERYIGSGLSGIMVGHLNVEALDPSGRPASLSPKITTDYLRNKLGFDGLIFTDALGMKGAATQGNSCVAALKAGADVLLGSESIEADIKAIEQAIAHGELKRSDIESRCRKLLAYKYALGLSRPQTINRKRLETEINNGSTDALNRRLAAAMITAVRNDDGILPLTKLADKKIAVVSLGGDGMEKDPFIATCRKYSAVQAYNGTAQLSSIKGNDVVIAAVYSDSGAAQASLSQLKGVKNLIPVFFVNPYKMAKFRATIGDLPTLLIAYDDLPELRQYAAQAIFGGINVTGRLPVNLNGIAKIGSGVKLTKTRLGYTSPQAAGMKPTLEAKIDSLINVGLRTKAFPGCQVLVAKGGDVVLDKCYGNTDYTNGIRVTDATLYDLASVSKATGTLPGVMAAYDQGLFGIDDKVSKHIPPLRQINDKANISVRQLLTHESGMPPSMNMFRTMLDSTTYTKPLIASKPTANNPIKIQNGAYGAKGASLRTDITSPTRNDKFNIEADKGIYVGKATYDTIMNRIYNIGVNTKRNYNYSCLNFCLLMDMEQRLTGESHDKWVSERVYKPLGMSRTLYRPLERFEAKEIAPTENDTYLRRQTVHGYAHDEIANFSGGVQGNAGLFSTADDLAKLCQMWLNQGIYGGDTIMSKETVKLFTTYKSPTCRRGLGFDKPDKRNPKSSPTTEMASGSTFGHLGFTGTVFWVDPEKDLIFIFLTNRINPTRDNSAFSKLDIRPKLMEQVYRAL